MDPECRAFLESDIANTTAEEGELWNEEVDRSHEMAVEAGAEFNDVDIEAFRTAVQPLIDDSLGNDVTRKLYADVRAAAE